MARSEQAQRRPEDRQFQERRSARDFDRRYQSWIGRTRLTAPRQLAAGTNEARE